MLPLLVLAGILVILGAAHRTEPVSEPSELQVFIHRPEEGGALILSCDGRTLILSGDALDPETLQEYLLRHGFDRAELLIRREAQPAPGIEAERTVLLSELAGKTLRLGTAEIAFSPAEAQGPGFFTVRFGEKLLAFLVEEPLNTVPSVDADFVCFRPCTAGETLLKALSPESAVVWNSTEEPVPQETMQALEARMIEYHLTYRMSVRLTCDGSALTLAPDYTLWD